MATSTTLESGSSRGTSSHCSNKCSSAEKVFLLETQVSSLRQQMSVLAVEMGLVYEWIRNTFGIQIINIHSPHYKCVHGPSFEMQAIQKSLELTVNEVTPKAPGSTSTSNFTTSSEGKDGRARKANLKPSTPTTKKNQVVGGATRPLGQSTVPANAKAVIATPTPSKTSSSASTSTSTARLRSTSAGIGQKRSGPGRPSGREKRFQCRHCAQSFSQQGHRRGHERIHTGEKPYKCRFCGTRFARSDHRIIHERSHTGEKPYKCRIAECPKSFGAVGNRKRHEGSHTVEKPYACEYCDKQFTRSTRLGNHIRTHTGENPFVCEHPNCGEAFHYSEALRRHKLRRHHGGSGN